MKNLMLAFIIAGLLMYLLNGSFRLKLGDHFNKLIGSSQHSSQVQSTQRQYAHPRSDNEENPSYSVYGSATKPRAVFNKLRSEISLLNKKNTAGLIFSQDRNEMTRALRSTGAEYSVKQNTYQNQAALSKANKSISYSLAQERASMQRALSNY